MSVILKDGGHSHSTHHVTATSLSLAYGHRRVVENVDLAVPDHQIGSIIGPNGSGKSTVLKALSRLMTPERGTVTLDGRSINTMPTREVAQKLGLLPQSANAPEGITIAELVMRGRYPYHRFGQRWDKADERALSHALEATGLSDISDRPVDGVSGGQRQRAWIALALAQETDVMLLDEPTTFLDIAYQFEVLDLLSDLNAQEGVTIVMVLHDLNLAARYSDWMLAMHDGRRAAFGTPNEVITEQLMHAVFGLHATVELAKGTNTPVVFPSPQHSLRARRSDITTS